MEFSVRRFLSDQEVIDLGEGLIHRTLPKELWTHEAHFASVVYLLLHRGDIDLDREIAGIISSYNIASGGQNTDSSGYHETLTRLYLRIIRSFLKCQNGSDDLTTTCNLLVSSELAHRQFPMQFYSRELLFSVRARQQWVEPDLKPFDF